jgi:hypothetical protein
MVVTATADGFRAAVGALRYLDGKEGVSFHTSTLPEDGCVRLLVKNLGKRIPESVLREELELLEIHVQGVMQLRSGRRDQDPANDRPPTPNFNIKLAREHEVSKVRSLTEFCELRVSAETYVTPKAHLNTSANSASDTRSVTADKRLRVSRVGLPPLRFVLYPARTSPVLWLRGKTHDELPRLY